jgi:hypothetical protein
VRITVAVAATGTNLASDVAVNLGASTTSTDPTFGPKTSSVTVPLNLVTSIGSNAPAGPAVMFTWCNVPGSVLAGQSVKVAAVATATDLQKKVVTSEAETPIDLGLGSGELQVHFVPQSILGTGIDPAGQAAPWAASLVPKAR